MKKQKYPNKIKLTHTDATIIERLDRRHGINVWVYEWEDMPSEFYNFFTTNKLQSKRRLSEWELNRWVLDEELEYARLSNEV